MAETGQEGGRVPSPGPSVRLCPVCLSWRCPSSCLVSVWWTGTCLGTLAVSIRKQSHPPPPHFAGAEEGLAVPRELGSHRAAHRCPSGRSQLGSAPGAPLAAPPPPVRCSGKAARAAASPVPGGLGEGPCWPVAAPPPPGAASSEARGAHGAGPAPAGVTPAQGPQLSLRAAASARTVSPADVRERGARPRPEVRHAAAQRRPALRLRYPSFRPPAPGRPSAPGPRAPSPWGRAGASAVTAGAEGGRTKPGSSSGLNPIRCRPRPSPGPAQRPRGPSSALDAECPVTRGLRAWCPGPGTRRTGPLARREHVLSSAHLGLRSRRRTGGADPAAG